LFGVHTGINDLNQTWEGDNHVLMMQAQQFLFTALRWLMKGQELPETLEFLEASPSEMSEFNCCVFDLTSLQKLFKARANYLVHKASMLMMAEPDKVADNFEKYQQFELRDMCQAYHDTYIFDTYMSWLAAIEDKNVHAIYEKLLLLHIQGKIIGDQVFFKPILGVEKIERAKKSIISLLKDIRKDILPLTDTLPFPNKMYGLLGNEDLQLYERILVHIKSSPKVSERPEWWRLAYINDKKA
jgi:hypothetical protein